MQSFSLPKIILKEFDDINKKFYWDKGDKHRPIINWDKIYKSKENGGTCIRKVENTNITLQLKLLWKIIVEPNTICVRVIREKYIKDAELMNYKKEGINVMKMGKIDLS